MRLFFQRHWVACTVALAAAFFMVLPQLMYLRALGSDYRGIPRFVDDDAWYYLVRSREVLDGHPMLGNPYFAEHKDKPTLQFFLPDVMQARLLDLLGDDLARGMLFVIPLFIALTTLLFYFAVVNLTRSRVAGVLAAAFLFLGMFSRSFNRPTVPLTITPFWIAEFLLLMALVRARRRSLALYAANVAGLGILFHLYPYFWSFYLSLIFVLVVLLFLFRRFFTHRHGAGMIARLWSWFGGVDAESPPSAFGPKDLLGIAGLALAIGLPYFLNFWNALQLPEFAETLRRDGALLSRFPAGIRVVVPAGVLLLLYATAFRFRALRWTPEALLAVAGLIAAIGVTNQHIVTAKHIEPSLHYGDIGILWSTFAASYLAVRVVSRLRDHWRKASAVAAAVFVTVFVGYSLVKHVRSYVVVRDDRRSLQGYAPILGELQRSVSTDDVVFANTTLSEIIPAYTSANVLFNRNANHFFISDAEVRDRFLLNHYFDPVDEAYLRRHERSLWGVQYIDAAGHARQQNKLRRLLGLALVPVPSLPEDEIARALVRFRELQQGDFEKELKRYQVDWLVWDRARDPSWAAVEDLAFLEKAVVVEDFVVYKVARP